MADAGYTGRRHGGSSPGELLQQLKGLGISGGRPAKTYAGLAAAGRPAGATPRPEARAEARPPVDRNAPSAFFSGRESPSPDLLAKVASLMKQTGGAAASGGSGSGWAQRLAATPGASERSTPEDMFGSGRATPVRSASGPTGSGHWQQRPPSVAQEDSGACLPGLQRSRRTSSTPEPPLGFKVPRDPAEPGLAGSRSRRATGDDQLPAEPAAHAWSEELLNWMLSEKAELLLEVQRAQRRQQELQQELDRARSGSDLETEVQRLKVERRMLLERLQRLSQQDAESASLLERVQMENDALTTELERSQEVCKEMLAARRAARDALSEMSAQNARLVSAYVEKKQEAAQLREELRQQQREAEVKVRALQAELHAAQAQYVELHGRLQHGGHPCSPDVAAHMASPPPPASGPAAGLPMPEAEPSPQHSTFGMEFGSGLFADNLPDFAGSPFSTPARPRAPPNAGQQPRSQPRSQQRTPPNTQQPAAVQQGKENASWSGNRGGPSSSARRKPPAPLGSDQEQEHAPAAARTPSGRGEWDKERSELLSLLERLQHQLSAHAEQQASPARQPAEAEPGRAQQRSAREQAAETPPGTAGSPSMQPVPVHAASTPGASPPPAAAAEEPSPAASTPLSHRSSSSTGPTPRRSHFSVPRHSRSPHRPRPGQAAGEELQDEDAGQEDYESSRGSDSSGRSSQTAAPPGRRASGVNLSQAFEGACSSGRSAGSRGGSARSSTLSEGMFGCRSSIGEEVVEDDGLPGFCGVGLFGSSSPPGAAGSRPLSPAPASSSPQATPPGMPSSPSQLPPSPVIPPMATPFAAQPPQEGETPAAAEATPQPEEQLQPEGVGAGGEGATAAVAAATPAACQAATGQPTPQSQRLADVERRNAALEEEVQRLRQLQQEAEERLSQEDLRRQIDQHKQAGNTAFQQQLYEQAVQSYTAGLELSGPTATTSAAVLLCNRAAALHAMGRYLDAVADCFRAEERDPSYARLYHRRADAYCALGAYDAAEQDLARLVQLGCGREVQARLADVQHKLRAQHPVNHYAVLGVKSSASAADIKAAYRSLALRFHPDKAGAGMPQPAADALFKLVAAANAALSDAERRRTHDLQCLRHKYRRFYSYHF